MNYPQQSLTIEQIDSLQAEQFKSICKAYEINPDFAKRLLSLKGYEIIIIADDSGSMNNIVTNPSNQNPYGPVLTRWDELKNTISIIVDIAAVMDRNGVDVYFLNRPPLLGVKNHTQLEPAFYTKASGFTPIVPVLQNIFRVKKEGNRLVILATDGKPTDNNGMEDVSELKRVLQQERGLTDYVTIVACTDDVETMSYLNGWDHELPRLDVVDDYVSEHTEVIKAQGPSFSFSFGDYVVKTLAGSIDPWFDTLDEKKISNAVIDKKSSKKKNKHKKCIIL